MKNWVLSIVLAAGLSSCCSFGKEVAVWEHVESLKGPAVVVYYPEHGTWNTPMMSAKIRVDGETVGKLCEGDFLVVPVEAGSYELSTSRDRELGCGKAFSRPAGGWDPVQVQATTGPVVLRYGEDPYPGPSSKASICYRHLVQVSLAKAREEVGRLDLIE